MKNIKKEVQCLSELTFHTYDLGHEIRMITSKKIMKLNPQ